MEAGQSSLYPFVRFSREDWARLPADDSFALSDEEVRSVEPHLPPDEARRIYLPLSRLLYLHVRATQDLYRAASAYLSDEEREVPLRLGHRRQRRRGQEHGGGGAAGPDLTLARKP